MSKQAPSLLSHFFKGAIYLDTRDVEVAQSPLEVKCGGKDLITFHFLRFALFEEDAEYYVREHITAMYPVLPTMQGANHILLKQAMEELAQLYRESTVTLSQQFVWMQLMLERTD